MGLIVETVREIYSTGVNRFNNTNFEHYIVYLEGYDEPFKMTKKVNNEYDFIPRVGDKINFEFDENRLKHVKLLINPNDNE
jgi:hypothetical protein